MLRATAIAATITLVASQAVAEPHPGIQNHKVQLWFIEEPCTKVIETIDKPDDEQGDAFGQAMYDLSVGAFLGQSEEAMKAVAEPIKQTLVETAFQGLAFGFLMGFEVANPDIRGDHETVLMRLRDDCAADPTKTAMTYLRSYAD